MEQKWKIFFLLEELEYKAYYNTVFSREAENKKESLKELNVHMLFDGTFSCSNDIPYNFDALFIHRKKCSTII